MLSNLTWAFAACRSGTGCMGDCVAVARQDVSWVCQQQVLYGGLHALSFDAVPVPCKLHIEQS